MLTFIHVVLAITSLVVSTASYFWPTKSKIKLSFVMTGLVITSGTYLILTTHAPMLKTCLAGLAYLSINLCLISFAQQRFAKESEKLF